MLLIKTLRIIFIMIPFFSFSQEKAAIQQQFNLTLDSINNEIIYQIKDSLYFLDAESLSIINSKKIYTYNLSNYHITKKGNSLLFLEREGGDILKLDSDNKLKKIDNSNINKFFIDNFNFVRKRYTF